MKGCTTVATPAMASARPCHTSNLLGLLQFQWSKIFKSVPPGLPVQGTFCRRCSDPWPKDQFNVARQLEEFPESGATTEAFLVAPPDFRALYPRKVFNISVTRS
eukprot:366411-Chlamydomonas_euryale.AAC.4